MTDQLEQLLIYSYTYEKANSLTVYQTTWWVTLANG